MKYNQSNPVILHPQTSFEILMFRKQARENLKFKLLLSRNKKLIRTKILKYKHYYSSPKHIK